MRLIEIITITLAINLLLSIGSTFHIQETFATFPGDNGKILFVSNRDGPGYDIYKMNADGSESTRLTNDNWAVPTDWGPTWSPDGLKIAFRSNRDHRDGEIYVMNLDGSEKTRLTFNTLSDASPAWSPDGSKIVFGRFDRVDGDDEIFAMNADGTGATQLTFNRACDWALLGLLMVRR